MNTRLQSNKNKATQQVTAVSSYKGPLPPAQQFAGYEETLAGAANRILILTEQEQQHRFKNNEAIGQHNKKIIDNDHIQKMAGVIVGGVLSLTLIISGLIMVLQGHDWAGGTIVTSTLVGLAGVFVFSKSKSKNE